MIAPEERKDWGYCFSNDARFKDADGKLVKRYDDVCLVEAIPIHHAGTIQPEEAPAGCIGTVIMFTSEEPQLVEVECDFEDGFAFAYASNQQLRLYRTTEEKWPRDAAHRKDWRQDGHFADTDGTMVKCYDDVTLLAPAKARSWGNGEPVPEFPAGTRATILFYTLEAPVLVDAECYTKDGFGFAHVQAAEVRLLCTAEAKRAQN